MKFSRNQIRNALLTLALGVIFAFYSALKLARLHDTAALYVGLPLALSLLVSLIETEKPSRTAMKVLTIAILLSPIIIGEGFICMIMASPILYGITYAATKAVESIRKSRKNKEMPLKAVTALTLLFLMSLEGTTPLLSMERYNEITVEKSVPLSVEEVKTAMSRAPKFDKKPDTFFMRLFPGPSTVTSGGLNIGDRRSSHLIYNKWVIMNPLAGDVVFEVADKGKNFVKFRLVEDTSYINLYLVWQDATTTFERIDDHTTKVKVTLTYSRKLDPGWYFSGMERSAVHDVAETMIDSLSPT